MFLDKKKKELLAEKDRSGTPKMSRSIVPFDKYVTAKDQIELIEKDISGGFRFSVTRLRLSGGEQRGVLVVGVTALSFLNSKDKIVFCHPYRIVSRYMVNAKGLLEYSLEIDKGKTLIYQFESTEPSSIVTAIDRNSLRLEKVIASSSSSASSSAPMKSPRGQPATIGRAGGASAAPFVDHEAVAAASATSAPIVTPKTKIADIPGMRFNVKVDGQRMVAVVNEDGVLLIDPSAVAKGSAGGTQSMACQRFPLGELISVTCGEKNLTLTTGGGSTVVTTPDARSIHEEIVRLAGQNGTSAGGALDKVAQLIATAARLAVTHNDLKSEMFGVLEHSMHGIKSKDFAPGAFAKLREKWGVPDKIFVEEWTSDLLRRVDVTPGLSKTRVVVHSKTELFVAMEVSSQEASAFHKVSEAYFNYVTRDAPLTLLPKLLGIFQSDHVYFVIYKHPRAPQCPVAFTTYDIAPNGNRLAPPTARGKVHSHLLDKDFLLDHRVVFSSFRVKKTLLLQLAQDSAFLVKSGFSDFVLQVSVSQFDESLSSSVQSWADSAGGHVAMSPLNDEVSIVQIGNICVGSDEGYAQKFYNFCKKRVFSSPDPTPADLLFEKMLHAQVEARVNAHRS